MLGGDLWIPIAAWLIVLLTGLLFFRDNPPSRLWPLSEKAWRRFRRITRWGFLGAMLLTGAAIVWDAVAGRT